jgi:methylenetetrahydrofolate reductase (NADPH)
MAHNPIREALASGTFCYMVELVASQKTPEARLFEAASELAQVPGLVGAGITSYAGGSAGHDPIRVGAAVRARGLTPNVHLTCVNRDRLDLRRALEDLHALGIENVFAITGDFPKGADPQAVLFDLDSVQLVEMIRELREAGMRFHVSVAVSPFKYTQADCAYQYLKLEKKIAAGADFAITQLGYDARKFRELKRYLDQRGLRTPLMGNVYLLPARAAEKFSKGEPPGCWVSKELVERIQEESQAPDKGLAARLERAARMAAVLRGLGYAGAYLGGDHDAGRLRWVIRRAEEIAPDWERYAEELAWAPQGGFYFFESSPAPNKREFWPGVADRLGQLFPANQPGPLRRFLTGVMRWFDRRPAAAHALERAEYAFKKAVFGCKNCGNCVLGLMQYVCPMTCPKNLRNGPCGGTRNGQCEVLPDQPCVWVKVYERAQAAERVDELKTYIPPRNRGLQGTSSYINYFLDRDYRPGHSPPLITIAPAPPPAAQKPAAVEEGELVKTREGK